MRGFRPAVRYAHLTPDGVRYANDVDRREEVARAASKAMAAIDKDAIRLEPADVPNFCEMMGGPNVIVTKTVILVESPTRAHITHTPPRAPGMSAARLQDVLMRKLEETREDAQLLADRTSIRRKLMVAERVADAARVRRN